MKYFVITLITGLLLVFLVLNFTPVMTGHVVAEPLVYEHLSPSNFKEKSEEGVLLDIRTPQEFHSLRLDSSLNIDFYSSTFREELDGLDKSEKYFIYCRTGSRTSEALTLMKQLGFEQVYVLEGGITNWASQGLPIIY